MREVARILCGSHLYGTNVPDSDQDVKYVFIPNASDILLQRVQDGLCEKSPEGNDFEGMSLQQFLRLACEGQINAMDMLFAPASAHLISPTVEWLAIRENRGRLVSKNCEAFVGYCRQQVKKYVVKAERAQAVDNAVNFLASAAKKVPNPAVSKLFEVPYLEAFADNNSFTELIVLETAHGRELHHLSVCETMVPVTASIKTALSTFERKAADYGQRVRSAQALCTEDWKSMYHAVRVAYEAIELMETGMLVFPRPERELLLRIRTGQLSYEAASEMIEENLVKVDAAVKTSKLPEKPDYGFAEELVKSVYRNEIRTSRL